MPAGRKADGSSKREQHLLSGLIRCGSCGARHTLAGKDYYRCARNRERGTCDSSVTVRLHAVEEAVLSTLQSRLLTPDLVKLFAEEFNREVARLTRDRRDADMEAQQRLAVLDVEIANLAQHFLSGTVSPTLSAMLADREAEKERLVRRLDAQHSAAPVIVPHPTLIKRYEEKVASLRATLNDKIVQADAIRTLRSLIGAVTVHARDNGGVEIEVEASTGTLIDL
jgi:hypothetical protein